MVSVAGSPDASEAELAFAFELGGLLAAKGYCIACGGGGGVMEAVCRGAALAGGTTIGILPGTEPDSAGPSVSLRIPTGLGSGRNRVVALAGKVLVAVGGRYGTLSEVAQALDAGRSVMAFGNWSSIPGVTPVASPAEVIGFLEADREVGQC